MGNICVQDRNSVNVSSQMYRDGEDSPTDISSKYSIKKQLLGKGNFGVVRKAACRATGDQYAIKKTPKRKLNLKLRNIHAQRKALIALDHPNIIKYYEIYEDETSFYEVMQLATGRDLLNLEDRFDFTEAEAAQIMKSAFSAVSYLHSRGIIHRDLKPNNFKYASEDPNAELVLIDFGFSRFVEDGEILDTKLGTPYYLAPEVIERSYDLRSEYWSLGVMMYLLLVGRHPFVGSSFAQTIREIQEAELQLDGPEWNGISSEAKDLLRKLLTRNPFKRITAEEALKHSWIKMSQTTEIVSEKSQQYQKEAVENHSTDIDTISDFDKNDAHVRCSADDSIQGTWMTLSEPSTVKAAETRGRDIDNILLEPSATN